MHGLINKALEIFLREQYGSDMWERIVALSGSPHPEFEPMWQYPDHITADILYAASRVLDKPRAEIGEDVGAWVGRLEAIRRLMRFSGPSYIDMILSMEELSGRLSMIVPDLHMPPVSVRCEGAARFQLTVASPLMLWTASYTGVLRSMADDYGVLALISHDRSTISISVSDARYSDGRTFHLSAILGGDDV